MNSNGNAPKRVSVKKKKPLTQKAALWLLQKIEGKDAKKTPSKHAVRTVNVPKRVPQNSAVKKNVDSQNLKKRPAPAKAAAGPAVKKTVKPAAKRTVVRPIKGKQSFRNIAIMYIRKLLGMKKKLYIGAGVAVFLLIMLILSRTVLFKINNIVVVNPSDVSYTSEQISMETGIVSGTQNLFSCDLEKVEKNIEQRLPFIGDAVVERDFPSSLKVTVTPTTVSAAIVHGAGYLLIDDNGKMLEYTQITPDGVPTLRTAIEISPDVGHYLGDEARLDKDANENPEKNMIELFSSVKDAAESAGLLDGITTVDIRDARAITLTYENRLTLHLGNESMLETKLKTGAKIIAAETDSTRNRTGAINLEKVGTGYAIDTVEDVTEFAEETTNESRN